MSFEIRVTWYAPTEFWRYSRLQREKVAALLYYDYISARKIEYDSVQKVRVVPPKSSSF